MKKVNNKLSNLSLKDKKDLSDSLDISLKSLYNKIRCPDAFTYREIKIVEMFFGLSIEEILKEKRVNNDTINLL